jgi:hypothetical protein
MNKQQEWLIKNKCSDKVISGTERGGYYYTSDAIRDYEKEKLSNLLYALLDAVREVDTFGKDMFVVKKDIMDAIKRSCV